ncbi:MAG: bifunctional UDP-N-acetylglucosamine diphosphorylase/glucosamine-1-phosphate N-acetyltransferase GlmU [Deltaproteobacteria bacterium]|nr:bifunctional UDP-N-acetylglucosamine diphosphorylase/glucosamine-1-phosphate N-acetyltransferase GlmU [Deltaproteobacteria bacterium]MBI3293471.1 bifunctional UDP-N-acetylglucosamine diphosphorylase/glucosamine-1-phosphate N-acetyltransferase GlmU [Deltaproteobacteria bacterium]
MRSQLPKVLHPVVFRPMLHYVVERALELPHGLIGVVVGHGADEVRAACTEYPMLQFIHQAEQLGTGHAILQAQSLLGGRRGQVLVLSGDVILLKAETLRQLVETKGESTAAVVVTTRLSEPKGYGRIIRGAGNHVVAIREELDCNDAERKINEINSGVYLFDTEKLYAALDRVTSANAQKEYYLTDVVREMHKAGDRVEALEVKDSSEVLGINDQLGLHAVEKVIQRRINDAWMAAGVSFEDPESTWIDDRTQFSSEVRVEGNCRFIDAKIASRVNIESGCRIVRSSVGHGSSIKQGSYLTDSSVGSETSVGPYAHLRPKSHLGSHVKIGNFVEIKNATFADHAKASHLSYIGDATIGPNANLGCGFITCNYDGGLQKHHTTIGENVFVGSDSQMVAPVEVGAGSYVASGSTVTEDVPPDSLVISRGRQVTKPGYASKYRRGK